MLPITSKLGYFQQKMENNESFYDLDAELRSQAKQVHKNYMDGFTIVDYIISKDFWGIKELITIAYDQEHIQSIMIRSRSNKEPLSMLNYIENMFPMFQFMGEKNKTRMYSIHNSELYILIGTGVKHSQDNLMGIMREII